ncbi:hypothetical protein QQ045_022616 [Rhodiola kirilowii]
MAGRVTLVNSALNSIEIHNRRYWLGWLDICRPKDASGLGVTNPEGMMLAFHGKLALRFIQRKSLWPRFASFRFTVGSPGSPLWKAFSHLIPTLHGEVTWLVGRGIILASTLCSVVDDTLPGNLGDHPMHEVWSNNTLREEFLDSVPIAHLHHVQNIRLGSNEDGLIWKGRSNGFFSSKVFWWSF